MIIKVGTNNPIKVEAVKGLLAEYPEIADTGASKWKVSGAKIPSGVSEQPLSVRETYLGAFNRAVGAFEDGADLGIGIESGITKGPLGWFNFTAAVICNSEIPEWIRIALWDSSYLPPVENPYGIHFGQSTGFPLPPKIVDKIVHEGMDLDQAAYACGFVDVPNIGKVEGGFLGVLTKGRISRKVYSRQALQMALISLENEEMFSV